MIEQITRILEDHSSAISALCSLMMSITAIIMCVSLYQNRKALNISAEALKLQGNDFKIRNRPLVDATHARFGANLKSAEGDNYAHTVEIALENKFDVPATNFKAHCKIMLDDKVVKETKIDIGTLLRGTEWQGEIFLTKEIFEEATLQSKKLAIDFSATYSGVLGEKLDEYKTSFILNYFPENKDFRFASKNFD